MQTTLVPIYIGNDFSYHIMLGTVEDPVLGAAATLQVLRPAGALVASAVFAEIGAGMYLATIPAADLSGLVEYNHVLVDVAGTVGGSTFQGRATAVVFHNPMV